VKSKFNLLSIKILKDLSLNFDIILYLKRKFLTSNMYKQLEAENLGL